MFGNNTFWILVVVGVTFMSFRGVPFMSQFKKNPMVSGVLIIIVLYLTYTRFGSRMEWFDNPDTKVLPPCPPGSVRDGLDCRMKGEGESK